MNPSPPWNQDHGLSLNGDRVAAFPYRRFRFLSRDLVAYTPRRRCRSSPANEVWCGPGNQVKQTCVLSWSSKLPKFGLKAPRGWGEWLGRVSGAWPHASTRVSLIGPGQRGQPRRDDLSLFGSATKPIVPPPVQFSLGCDGNFDRLVRF